MPENKTPAYDALAPRQRAWVDAYFLHGLNASAASRATGNASDAPKHGHRMGRNGKVAAAIEERLAAAGMSASAVAFLLAEHATGTAADYVSFYDRRRRRDEDVPVSEAIRRTIVEVHDEEHVLATAPHTKDERQAAEASIRAVRRRLARLELLEQRDPEATVTVPGPVTVTREPYIDLEKLEAAGKMHLVRSVERRPDGGLRVELHDAQAALAHLARALGMFTDRVDLTSGGKALTWFDPAPGGTDPGGTAPGTDAPAGDKE